MNRAVIIGRLTKDPELRFTTGSGIALASFNLAVDRNFVGQNGKKEADFIPVICWRGLAESVANNLNKGRLVAVSGSIQTRKYQAQDGGNRYITEIVADEVKYLDWPKDKPKDDGDINGTGFTPVNDDDIPF